MRIELYGPLGIGKTTLARKLAEHLNWTCVEEPVANHPFLQDFYTDPSRYAFENAAHFITDYIHQVKKNENANTIFDAGIVLHKSYNALGAKTTEEETAMQALYAAADSLQKPDLIIHLACPSSFVMERIASRNRGFEKGVPEEFVQNLQKEIATRLTTIDKAIPVLTVDQRNFDFIANSADVEKLIDLIEQQLGPLPRQKSDLSAKTPQRRASR